MRARAVRAVSSADPVPDRKIAWASTEGATNAGCVEFEDAGGGKTAISLTLDYQPEGVVEKVGDLLHLVARDAEADLKKFKQFLARGPCKRGMAGNRPRWHRGCRNRRRGTTAAGDAGTGHACSGA